SWRQRRRTSSDWYGSSANRQHHRLSRPRKRREKKLSSTPPARTKSGQTPTFSTPTGDNAQNPSMSAIIGFLLCRKYLQLKRNPTKEQMQTIDRKVFSVLFPEIG
ncbi:MAG: hypothetical protein WBV41_02140, partial [Terriglobales bacterium]